MKEKKNKIKCSINMRLPKNEKAYYEYQLNEFVNHFDDTKFLSIQFGKQDMRGSESITFVDLKHCVPIQKLFNNKYELLGFVVGYNEHINNYGQFKDSLKPKSRGVINE